MALLVLFAFVAGLVISFTFATVALVYLLSALGLPDKLFRTLAIVVLGVVGVTLIVPGAAPTWGSMTV